MTGRVEGVNPGDGRARHCLHEAALMGKGMNVKHGRDSEDACVHTCVHTSEERRWSRQADQVEGSLVSFIAFSAFKQNCDSFEKHTNFFACVF